MTRNYCKLCKIKDQKGDYDYYKPHHCLNTLIRHETLTIDDLGKEENLGMIPNEDHLNFFLIEL